jgi:hypothetical protein
MAARARRSRLDPRGGSVRCRKLSFFEPPPPQAHRRPEARQPPWFGPPENEIGAAAPLRLVLAHTRELAVALVDVVAYSTGFTLRLSVRVHPEADEFDPHEVMGQLHGGRGGSPEKRLRFGIEFPDGRKATNLGPRFPPSQDPPEINLVPTGGGGGGGRSWQTGYWVYPLPPPGSVTLALAWPARGIEEQIQSVDAGPIVEAAAASSVLWEDNRPIRSSGPPPTTQGDASTRPVPRSPKR